MPTHISMEAMPHTTLRKQTKNALASHIVRLRMLLPKQADHTTNLMDGRDDQIKASRQRNEILSAQLDELRDMNTANVKKLREDHVQEVIDITAEHGNELEKAASQIACYRKDLVLARGKYQGVLAAIGAMTLAR